MVQSQGHLICSISVVEAVSPLEGLRDIIERFREKVNNLIKITKSYKVNIKLKLINFC